MNTQIQSGWQCPCCKVVYAPSMLKCECAKVTTDSLPDYKKAMLEAYKKFKHESQATQQPFRPHYSPRPMELAPNIAPYLDPSTRPICQTETLAPLGINVCGDTTTLGNFQAQLSYLL